MTFIDVPQRSDEWLKMRCACVTASRLADVVLRKKGKKDQPGDYYAAHGNYLNAKVREQMTGRAVENYVSPYMDKGAEYEDLAVEAYALRFDVDVQHGGLYAHDKIPRFLASPDGRIGEGGLIEIKYLTGCTTETNHLDFLENPDTPIPMEYQLQMLGEMSCSGRQWVDFCSYDPDMPKEHRLFVKRFPRDEQRIAEVEAEVCNFLEELLQKLQRIGQHGELTEVLARSVEALL